MVKIGLEIHGYLVCKEKLFCKCPASYKTAKPNTNICPICTAQPGSKPMLPNAEALQKITAIALMLGCKINNRVVWQRKHYDYPDLPKGYQDTISGAYSVPIGEKGEFLGIRIREAHLEEDPASWNPETGYIDYNRCGLPLVEIVTEPDFSSAEQVRKWLQQLVITLSYIHALEKAAGIKADVNISTTGERVEIKNLNSAYNIVKAIGYEVARQLALAKRGQKIERETRAYDERRKITIAMRKKELAADYRFIPDPDLPVIDIKKEIVEKIRKGLPELPHLKIERFVKEYKIEKKAASVLTKNKEIADFFEKVLTYKVDKKLAAYWTTIELLRILNYNKKTLRDVNIKAEHFAQLLELVKKKKITETAAKKILNSFIPNSFSPLKKLEKIERITDKKKIEIICKKVMEEQKKAVGDYKAGRREALHFLIGKVMSSTRGRADNEIVNEMLKKLLR